MWWLGIIIVILIIGLIIGLSIGTRNDPTKGMEFRPEKDITKIYNMNQRAEYYNKKRGK